VRVRAGSRGLASLGASMEETHNDLVLKATTFELGGEANWR